MRWPLGMRKLGTRLEAAATSLYRHVAKKNQLIELVVDDVYGELDVPSAAGHDRWRATVARTAADLRAIVLRHPWIAPELSQVGLVHIGPNVLRMASGLLARFEAAGFPADATERALGTLMAYLVGIATSEAAYLSLIARSGRAEQEWVAEVRPVRRGLAGLPPRCGKRAPPDRTRTRGRSATTTSRTGSNGSSTDWRPGSKPDRVSTPSGHLHSRRPRRRVIGPVGPG